MNDFQEELVKHLADQAHPMRHPSERDIKPIKIESPGPITMDEKFAVPTKWLPILFALACGAAGLGFGILLWAASHG